MKVCGKPAVTLQIHHLDDGEESDFVLSQVGRAATIAGCAIERPCDETNSILIHCLSEAADKEEKLGELLERAEVLLASLDEGEIEAIRGLDLKLTLVVESASWYVYFSPALLFVCGKKSIPVRVVDNEKFMVGINYRAGV